MDIVRLRGATCGNQGLAGLALLAFAAGLSLVCFSFLYPPASYLHAWNQVTTLAIARGINQSWINVFYPRDVTTLLSWRSDAAAPITENSFLFFEEFPLYHLLSAGLGLLGLPLYVAGRALSLTAFLLLTIGLAPLLRPFCRSEASVFFFTFSCFPLLYYGQAVMSDMAMLSCGVWGLVFLAKWRSGGGGRDLRLSLLLSSLACLFKSYWIVFCLIFVWELGRRRRVGAGLAVVVAAVFPVLCWHLWSFHVGGYQEWESHSVIGKISVIFSWEFVRSCFKQSLRYAGPAGLLLVAAAAALKGGKAAGLAARLPWWAVPWGALSCLYLAATADKIGHHDYYFLPLVPLFALVFAKSLELCWAEGEKKGKWRSLVVLLALVQVCATGAKYLKAVRPNPDILKCAERAAVHTAEDQLIAVFATDERYNSIHYYAKRRGLSVQPEAFLAEDYLRAGAAVLVVDIAKAKAQAFDDWLARSSIKPLLLEDGEFSDFKGRPRICRLYALKR